MFSVMIADTCPSKMRGTGFGFYYLLSGVSILVANLMSGWLWETYSPEATFMVSSAVGFLTWVLSSVLLKGNKFHS